MTERVLVVGGFSRSLVNFRGPLLECLRDRGHEVLAAAPEDEHAAAVREQLGAMGISLHTVPISRGGTNPVRDLATLRALRRLIREQRTTTLIAYTAKPVIYAGMAARQVGGVRFFPMITGLGYAFGDGGGLKRRLVRGVVAHLYRRSLAGAETVVFQNPDDERLFRERRLISASVPSAKVHGSGVDLEAFPPVPLPQAPIFLMLSRLVADKGVCQYVEAARIVRRKYPQAGFRLAGGLDRNPAGISERVLQSWIDFGDIEYLGEVQNVMQALAECRIYVLPSYREGTPRSVLEAMAIGRPIITTDAPGCRETVEDGGNGLLVPPRDAGALARAMIGLIERSDAEIQAMADASLEIARKKYDVNWVNRQMLEIMGL